MSDEPYDWTARTRPGHDAWEPGQDVVAEAEWITREAAQKGEK